jgi:aminopeptidase N
MYLTLILSSLLCVVPAENSSGWQPHLDAEILLHPSTGAISWRATLSRVGLHQQHFDFPLHSGLTPQLESAGSLTQIRDAAEGGSGASLDPQRPVPRRWWRVEFGPQNPESTPVILTASGVIQEKLKQVGSGAGRSFSSTPGTIEEQGVFLGGATSWLPRPEGTKLSFSIEVDLPAGWTAVSQGKREIRPSEPGRTRVRWTSEKEMLQEEVFLIAARFHEYSKETAQFEAQVFLRDDEPNLAAKYLEATLQYVEMYSKLIGPYPYSKFALVENFWESGYGMPSFTLLGPQVIRLPFIIRSSYPHEVLHNWWGNSVYVDYPTGNWCEGLTAYLADHLMKEGEGRGAEYRRDVLKKFGSYVQEGLDFPLRDFRSRHSGATEAVGYGKCLMLWHMIRLKVGEEAFKRGLQEFYSSFSFTSASFEDIAASIGEVAGIELVDWMKSWIETTGAPEFQLTVESGDASSRIVIEQVQEQDPFQVRVPVQIQLTNSPGWLQEVVEFSPNEAGVIPRQQSFEVEHSLAAVRVDPFFDVFRRLDQSETPPTIGDIFGASSQLIILPSQSPRLSAWRALAESWASSGGVQIILDRELDEIPAGRAIWFLGEPMLSKEYRSLLTEIQEKGASEQFTLASSIWNLPDMKQFSEKEPLRQQDHCGIQVARQSGKENSTMGWIRCYREAAIPGLARKLPHYGKYSYLLFEGDEPTNVGKGEWSTGSSPLSWTAEGVSVEAMTDSREPLARPGPVLDGDRMISDVRWLADPQLEGRENGSVGLERATQWVADRFQEIGLKEGAPDGSFFDCWSVEELQSRTERDSTLRNVIGVIPGTDDSLSGQSVVVLAHVDHLGRGWPDVRSGNEGKIHPGADDNASGVAVMLETARILAATHRPARSVIFVATSAEEWGLRGASRYIESMEQWPAERAISVISIDAVGRLSEGKLLALGIGTATEWIHIARGVGFTTGVAATAVNDDPGGSDQVPFHALGVPGIQLTTGAHDDYHRPGDTADKVDTAGMVQVATWLREALLYLSDRSEPLTSTLDGAAGTKTTAPVAGRRVFLGTIPDFADTGPGVRIEGVVKDSPAQAAGLREGDRLLSLDGTVIDDLRGYSNLLKQLEAGDTVLLVIERKDDVFEVNVVLRKR